MEVLDALRSAAGSGPGEEPPVEQEGVDGAHERMRPQTLAKQQQFLRSFVVPARPGGRASAIQRPARPPRRGTPRRPHAPFKALSQDLVEARPGRGTQPRLRVRVQLARDVGEDFREDGVAVLA